MTTIIFRIGLLVFFVLCIIFGLEDFPLFEIITKSFIGFIAVIVIGTTILGAISVIAVDSKHNDSFTGSDGNDQSATKTI